MRILPLLGLAALSALSACDRPNVPTAPATPPRFSARSGAQTTFRAVLSPLNARLTDRAVTGEAVISISGDVATLTVDAKGILPSQVHMQHIHGNSGGSPAATCPKPTADADRDGVLTFAEGLPFYGPVLVQLNSALGAGGTYPTATSGGRVTFSRTTSVGNLLALLGISDVSQLDQFVVVLHGENVNGLYDPSTPVACGEIR